ncbi:uncharacterized protein LOC124437301 [Xenia sp. Carnegie-2017]|uniref:uncharacterized protein LOC124437301 n=1 Tax=Xenia sp. Carnegie-2017 TaxID=2897299 RepID=UPI001F047015|nr:uncharacterized protein LOC124437301 [Xenia sp. Carnegie-2017]
MEEEQNEHGNEQINIENQVGTFTNLLNKMPKHMLTFAKALQSLYYEKKVGSSFDTNNSEVVQEFKKMRDETRDDAFKYLKVHLPLVEKLLTCIQHFFQYYQVLSYEDWGDSLKEICDDVRHNKENALIVAELHEKMELKERLNSAKGTFQKIMLDDDLKKKIEKNEQEAELCNNSEPSNLHPIFSFLSENFSKIRKKIFLANAVAAKNELEIRHEAVSAVTNTLIEALNESITCVKTIVSFFSIIEKDIEYCIKANNKSSSESHVRRHFQVMKGKSQDIGNKIQMFFASLPTIYSSIKAIPMEDIDQNYVEEWLNDKLEEIANEMETHKGMMNRMIDFISNRVPRVKLRQNTPALPPSRDLDGSSLP